MENKHKFIKKQKLLNKEEEYQLISSWQNTKDNKSLVKLLDAYKKLVVSLCKKFSSYGLPKDDLIQEGTMGLMYAIEKFDISKGFRLSTYSRWWIRAMIQDYIIKNWSIVKNGSTASQKILFFSFNKGLFFLTVNSYLFTFNNFAASLRIGLAFGISIESTL